MSDYLKKAMIKLVVTIVDRGKGDKVTKLYNEENIHFHFICYGEGTATSEILDVLGIGATDKDVVLSMVPGYKVNDLLSKITNKMNLNKAGKGIIFTLPLSGISSIMSRILNKEVQSELEKMELELEKELEKAKIASQNSLIISIVNQGYSETVMDAAKEVGATGGTILHARGAGYEEAENFLGISIQAEKEVVAILASKENRCGIMEAINQVAGIKSEARGIVFSMPVGQMAGIS